MVYKPGLGAAVIVQIGGDAVDDGGTHDGGVRDGSDVTHRVGRIDAKPDGDGQIGVAFEPFYGEPDIVASGRVGPRNAQD